MRLATRIAGLAAPLLCGACSGWQSALDPHGAQAESLDHLIWFLVIVCAAIWALVVLVLAGSLLHRRPPASRQPLALDHRSDERKTIIVAGALAASVVVITVLTLASFLATRGLAPADQDALVIRVRGYQWWWQVTYVDPDPARTITSANEIHVPTGRPVRIELEAADVIHSFWVPSLAGKQDLIPGRANSLAFTAVRPGIYRGQCAEFCGLQHAHMAFFVIADEPATFEAWRTAQLAPAAAPTRAEDVAGLQVFTSKACAACHTVRGTQAAGTLGPDLTHVGSRRYIAAGLLETTRGSLAAWIADPQTLKAGSNMPMVALGADELKAVSAYLASLE